MTTFTIRVTSPATNVGGTGFGNQPDLGDPSYWDLYVTGSTPPLPGSPDVYLPNGTYDAFCLNPLQFLNFSPRTTSAQAYAGDDVANFVPNQAPNCSGAFASTEIIWPPNHKMVPIQNYM